MHVYCLCKTHMYVLSTRMCMWYIYKTGVKVLLHSLKSTHTELVSCKDELELKACCLCVLAHISTHAYVCVFAMKSLMNAILFGHLAELTVVCVICWDTRKPFIHTVLHLSCLTTVLFEQFPQPVHNVAIEHTVGEAQ